MKDRFLILTLLPFASMANTLCPATFNDFLLKFADDTTFQTEHIQYPLDYSYIDSTADPEPRTVRQKLSKSDLLKREEYPYPPIDKIKTNRLAQDIISATPSKMHVRLQKPDTGFLLEYIFEKNHDCWILTRFDDYSI